jgi:CO/xanthine dehydrogenase Mo-binding subunit
MERNFINIGKNVKKSDGLSLATGRSRFTDDFHLDPSALHVAFLWSPHAHARILSIDTDEALKLDGVVDILHCFNTERILHTTAGQGFPEPSPYDTALFNKKMLYVGDRVAAILADNPETAKKALSLIRVQYEELPAIFDMEKAMDKDAPVLHDDGDQYAPLPVDYEPSKNMAAHVEIGFGNYEKGYSEADFIIDESFTTQQTSHCAIEPHCVTARFDERGRLVIISTTQVPFHARRIVSRTTGIPIQYIRVIKPRIGGGFGGKQEVFLEQIAALFAYKHKKPVRIILSRSEVFISSRTRNPMRVRIKAGVKESTGEITALTMDALMNTGAYGSHALTVLSNAGAKVLPLLNKIENLSFVGNSVYTNTPVGGAYRGYGATKGYFALNQVIDMIARKLDTDPLEYLKKWCIKEGETSGVFRALGEGQEGVAQIVKSGKLPECIDEAKKAFDWDKRYRKGIKEGDLAFGAGFSVSMQGSGIPRIDMGSAHIKINEDASFNLYIGATDIGTGSDTIMAQIAAEVLSIPAEKIIVLSSDTDLTPFDVGAYASSTTYVSGGAVRLCAEKAATMIIEHAAGMMGVEPEGLLLRDGNVYNTKTGKSVTLSQVGYHSLYTHDQKQIQASASFYGTESPPPFACQLAWVSVDIKTGVVKVLEFVSAVDCGQPLNPKLAEGQIEGGALNSITYALTEEYVFDKKGRMKNPSFWDYKIFTLPDMPVMKTIIVPSYEETGPFGAKSVGEIG